MIVLVPWCGDHRARGSEGRRRGEGHPRQGDGPRAVQPAGPQHRGRANDEAGNVLARQVSAIEELIATTPARTAAGVAEQIWLALEDAGAGPALSDNARAGLSCRSRRHMTLYEQGGGRHLGPSGMRGGPQPAPLFEDPMMSKSPGPNALTKLEVLAGAIHAFAAKLLAPVRRPQPIRICPTLADTPDAPVLEDAPTVVTVAW